MENRFENYLHSLALYPNNIVYGKSKHPRKAFPVPGLLESKNCWRKRRRQSDGWQFLEPETSVAGKSERVNVFFGNQQHDFVAAVAQHFGHSDSGKKVSTGPATCDDRIHKSWLPIFG